MVVAGAAYFVAKKVSEHTEEPDYDVVRQDGDIEIRDYDGMVVAETVKSGYHEKARRIGFETLADYIFANNRSGKKIPMTAPVLQQLSEAEGRTRGWAIRFVMPKRFTKAALPAARASSDVKLKEVPAKRVVVDPLQRQLHRLARLEEADAALQLHRRREPEAEGRSGIRLLQPALDPGHLEAQRDPDRDRALSRFRQ